MSYTFAEVAGPKGAPLFFLFHGTGGDEHDLIDLGAQLLPGAHLVSPRGDVSEHGALRFFRRTGEGLYDMIDLERGTTKMAGFLRERIAVIQPSSVTALGFSNGANILASVLFSAPELIDRAVLMHPLIPFQPAAQPGLKGRKVQITAGRADPIAPVVLTETLFDYFVAQGAEARLDWQEGGHQIRQPELLGVRDFLAA